MDTHITALHANPFCILGVTPRDDRRKIVESAEERALQMEGNLCAKARADLTNPRIRLSCEVAWMPGVAQPVVEKILQMLADTPQDALGLQGLPSLTLANVMSAASERLPADETAASVAGFMSDFGELVDRIDPEAVLRDVNGDRAIAGFPEVRGMELIEEELAGRRRTYRVALKNLLDSMHPTRLIATMTEAVKRSTQNGDKQGSSLIEDLVDSYEVEVQGFLNKERDNIKTLLSVAREVAQRGEMALIPTMERLEAIVRKWGGVAQPMQISAKSRGVTHPMSVEVANDLRNLSVELNNTYCMPVQLRRMIKLLRELFSEMTMLMEWLDEDSRVIGGYGETTDPYNISFRARVGFPLFKRELVISPDGVQWKGRTVPLASITRVRIGGKQSSIVGIAYTQFFIGFGDNDAVQTVRLWDRATTDVITDRLWRAVCVGLINDMISELVEGTAFHFGSITIEDDAVTLVRQNRIRFNDRVRLGWHEVEAKQDDGCFVISQSNNSRVNGSALYLVTWNVHLLEHVVRNCLTKRCLKLSDSMRG